VERVPRDRRSLDILSVKKEAKLSVSEVNDVQVGRGDADLRQSNLLTICQRQQLFRCKHMQYKKVFQRSFFPVLSHLLEKSSTFPQVFIKILSSKLSFILTCNSME